MKKYILVLLLTNWCYSQDTSGLNQNNKLKLGIWDNVNGQRFAIGYLTNFEAEYSFLITSYPEQEQGFGGMLMRKQFIGIGAEFLQIGNTSVVGAKLSYENSIAFFSGQIATDFLVSDKGTQVRLMPKVGLSLFGFVTAYYGWNIPLKKKVVCRHMSKL